MNLYVIFCAGAGQESNVWAYDEILTSNMKDRLSRFGGVTAFVTGYSPLEEPLAEKGFWANYATEDKSETRLEQDALPLLNSLTPAKNVATMAKNDPGAKFVFVGASNGAVVAGHLALKHKDRTLGLVCLSGVPAMQHWSGISKLSIPKIVTIGWKETYFGGASGLYEFAKTAWFDVVTFGGGHAREDRQSLLAVSSLLCSKLDEVLSTQRGRSPRGRNREVRKNRSRSSRPPRLTDVLR